MRLRPDHLLGAAVALLIVAAMLIATLLTGCGTEPLPVVVSKAQAVEFDPAPAAARPYRAELTRAARSVWGLSAPIPVLAGQIHQESAWNPNARSPVGAQGLAQFMPATARDWADEDGVQPYNPAWAFRAQSRYLMALEVQVAQRDPCHAIGAALSAYNGGLGHYRDRRRLASDQWDFWQSIRTVLPPKVSPANQRENEQYPLLIVYKHQRAYLAWGGQTRCLV